MGMVINKQKNMSDVAAARGLLGGADQTHLISCFRLPAKKQRESKD